MSSRVTRDLSNLFHLALFGNQVTSQLKNKFPMASLNRVLFLVFVSVLITACMSLKTDIAPLPETYHADLEQWKEQRVETLKGPTNWLRLEGIYWMSEGENSFGSGEDQDLILPEGTIPAHAGVMILNEGVTTMRVAEGVQILHNGEPVTEMVMYDGGERYRAEHENLEWFIDNRGDTYGLRLYNKENPKADAFEGFPAYPVNPDWHLHAEFVPNSDSLSIILDNVIGEQVERYSPGRIRFTAEGERVELIAFEANSGLFIMFSDRTKETETYHAGRYLIIPFPDENGRTIIDFNRAYNPPCAFNIYTTCQLPPPGNRLDLMVTAGEKRPVEWQGL
ncbi:MAG: DUF1684 domain-containing protein [Balneolaceae bacterium]|nr:MAG: DUF1684 domain-containing protein [Balneolaceae bacterium]